MRRKAEKLKPPKPSPSRKSDCPRAHFHRPGTYCKACDTLIQK